MSIRPLGVHRFSFPAPKVSPAVPSVRFGMAAPEQPDKVTISPSRVRELDKALDLQLPSLQIQEGDMVTFLARWAALAAKAVRYTYQQLPYPAEDTALVNRLNAASEYFEGRSRDDLFQEHPGANLRILLEDANKVMPLVRERMDRQPFNWLKGFIASDRQPNYDKTTEVPKTMALFMASSQMLGKVRDGFLATVAQYNADAASVERKPYKHATHLSPEAWKSLDLSV